MKIITRVKGFRFRAMGLCLKGLCCFWACSGLQAATYVVKAGETLYGIAQANGLTVNALKKANPKVKPENLAVGAVLQLPPPGPKSTPAPSSPQPAAGSYEVQPGETLTKIAKDRGMSVKELLALNPQLKPERMRAGQHIRVTRALQEEKTKSTAASTSQVQAEAAKREAKSKATQPSRDGGQPAVGESTAVKPKPMPIENASDHVADNKAKSALPEAVAVAKATDETAPPSDAKNAAKAGTTGDVTNYRLIKLEKEMTLLQIANEYQTTPEWINRANGWNISSDQVLSVDSEVNVPNK